MSVEDKESNQKLKEMSAGVSSLSFKLQAPKTTSSVGVQWYDFSPGCGSLSPNDALCTNIPSEKYNSKVREGLEVGSLP
jgi:hypothetical protein